MQLKDDKTNVAPGTTVDIDISIKGLRATKVVAKNVAVGIDIGTADVLGTTGGAWTLRDTVPMGDVFVKYTPIAGGKGVAKTSFAVLAGYRFLKIDSIDPDGAALDFVKPVNDLSGLFIGISLGLAW